MHDAAARSRVAAAQSNWTQYPHGQTAKGLVHSVFSRFGARSISRGHRIVIDLPRDRLVGQQRRIARDVRIGSRQL